MRIQSDSHPGTWYAVEPVRGTCTCPDAEYRRRRCKHIRKAQSMSEQGQIHAAIAAIYGKVGYVQKDKQAPAAVGGYKFAGEADFIEAIRPHMAEHKVYAHVNRVREIQHEVVPTKNGQQNRVTLVATVRFTHEDGSFIESEATGEGMDTGDKASNKAMTGALKYALRQTFLIETGNDPDGTPSSDQERFTRQPSSIEREESATVARQNGTPPTSGSRPTNGATALTVDQQKEILRVTDGKPLTVGRVIGGSIQANNWQQKVAEYLHETGQTFESFAESLEYGKTGAKA